jgi:hypothetical protein
MNKKNKTLIKIVEKDLMKDEVWGYAYVNKNLIELEQLMKGRRRFSVLIHELVHKALPELTEKETTRVEKILFRNLWAQNYRKVDQ